MKRIFLIVCLITASMSFAKKWDATYISKLIAGGEIDKVIDFYKGRYYGDNRDPQDAFKIAELYVKKKEYPAAMEWYDKESQLINTSKVNLFNYANTNRLMGEYQKALDGYLMYAALTGDVNKVMDLANQCEKILKASVLSYNYKLENYTYNTSADETNVAVLRTNPVYVTIKDGGSQNEQTLYEIYQVVRQFDHFAEPAKAYKNNVPKLVITSLSFARDGNTVVFSAKEEKAANKKSKPVSEKIYLADNLAGSFLNVRPFPFSTEAYTFRNPSFNTDGTEIYFSSNQPGGQGGFDIWVSRLAQDKWTTPVNLGKLLNSKADEMNPFVVQDGRDNTLYFSSDREGGFGGFDIYAAKRTAGLWQDVEIQPAPVNSAGDEVSAIYDAETRTGYFSSSRTGGAGGFDLYRFTPFNLKLLVYAKDTFSEKSIDYALVQVFDGTEKLFEGVTDGEGKAVFQVNKDKNYTLKISKDGYRPLLQKINSSAKGSGDSVVTDALLKQDAQFSVSKGATNNLTLDNFIIFTGKVTDGATGKPANKVKMRMVNYTTQKLREVDVDAGGKFEIKLLLNNNYKVIFENQEHKITDELTTFGLERNSVKVRDYLLTGNKFKLTENIVFKQGTLPPDVKLTAGNNTNTHTAPALLKHEPITQRKIDSLKTVIAGDKIYTNPPPSSLKSTNVVSQPTITTSVQPPAASKNAGIKTHTVQPNQTLYSIAKMYNVSMDDLKGWNKITGINIKTGSELIVAVSENTTSEKPADVISQPSELPVQSVSEAKNTEVKTHTVQPKQTLYSVAKMYNISLDDLRAWNKITGNDIKSGTVLIVEATENTASLKQTKTPEPAKEVQETTATVPEKNISEVTGEKAAKVTEVSNSNKPAPAKSKEMVTVMPETSAKAATQTVSIAADSVKTETVEETYLAADIVTVNNNKKVRVTQEEKTKTTKKNNLSSKTAEQKVENAVSETVESNPVIAERMETVLQQETENKQAAYTETPKVVQPSVTISETPKAVYVSEKTESKQEETDKPEAKTLPDIYYKVQLASYDQSNIKFPEFSALGKVEEVKAYERYIYRLGNFESLDRAKEILELVRSQGYFVAFILQYNKDKVTGIVK